MSFDKTKAMRNAERYLSQGKISSAIGEFKQVVANDPRDFSTMNMLGDLYVKNSESRPAADCYKVVAEHYAKQGFAQKAIAVYNKIAKINPNSPEITIRLAELYREKGSVGDARSHYEKVAQIYEKDGKKVKSLEIWRTIAELEPTFPDSLLKVGEGFAAEKCAAEAAEAFAEAGRRFENRGEVEKAYNAYSRALEHDPKSPEILARLVETGHSTGHVAEANAKVIAAHDDSPNNSEIHSLLVDCHAKVSDLEAAERSLVKLIEQDPTNYPKLLELSTKYLDSNDASSAIRMLSIASEHMLIQGKAEELSGYVASVLQLEPEHIDALRIMVRCASWLKDESGMRASLTLMSKTARAQERLDDERYALSQLVLMLPQDAELAKRLVDVNKELGIEDEPSTENLFDKRFGARPVEEAVPAFALESSNGFDIASDFAIVGEVAEENGNGHHEVETFEADEPIAAEEPSVLDDELVTESVVENPEPIVTESAVGADANEDFIQKEIEGIRFYIESGFAEIAETAIAEFEEKFGDRSELSVLRSMLDSIRASAESNMSEGDAIINEYIDSNEKESKDAEAPVADLNSAELVDAAELSSQPKASLNGSSNGSMGIQDLRNELGLDEIVNDEVDSDYDTHYHTAVAYQEMYLLEDAIKEFQAAVALVQPNDGTRRFFQCSNLLGHCFMQLGKPHLAVRWFDKTLSSAEISDEERLGIWYELASAYEADGDYKSASKYYEQVYAEDIDFRDVSSRVQSLAVSG